MSISWLFSLVLMFPCRMFVVAKADDGLIPAHLPY